MSYFDLENVRGYVDRTTNDSERNIGRLCMEYYENVREWGRKVFSGDLEFDEEVETLFLDGSKVLRIRLAAEMVRKGSPALLRLAKQNMDKLFDNWFKPQLSVAPGPRLGKNWTPEQIAYAKKVLASLPVYSEFLGNRDG